MWFRNTNKMPRISHGHRTGASSTVGHSAGSLQVVSRGQHRATWSSRSASLQPEPDSRAVSTGAQPLSAQINVGVSVPTSCLPRRLEGQNHPPASGLPMSSVCGVLQHHLVLIVPHRLGFSLRASLQLFFLGMIDGPGKIQRLFILRLESRRAYH